MCDLLTDFAIYWKDYGIKHGLDTDSKCVEHAIRASFVMDATTPAVFDWRRYIKDHPDLQRALGKGNAVHVNDATSHYLNHGIREKRRAYILGTNDRYVYDFDWETYDRLNPDVYTQRHRNVGRWHCFRHWCEYGYKEGRRTRGERLVAKTDAAISTDDVVNKQWRDALNGIIKLNSCKSTESIININHNLYYPLVVMPTYNRAANIERSIQMMLNQTYKKWTFLIIDDGSTVENKTLFRSIQDRHRENKQIVFLENDTNKHIAFTLNRGIQYFLQDSKFTHFTWVSDDNEYYPTFLEKLYISGKDFTYSWYDILYTTEKNKGRRDTQRFSLGNLETLLDKFNGCASFMWSKCAIQAIGMYTYSYPGCEDYEYLLRTFAEISMDKIEHIQMSLMQYLRHPDAEFEKMGFNKIVEYTNAIKSEFRTKLYSNKISIVMAYYNRKPQTLETLRGFEQSYAGKYNFEVIIVDDNSSLENRLEEDIKEFTFPINLIMVNAEEKGNRLNQSIAYNKGLAEATGEIIIVQNSECLHIKDMLNHIMYNFKERDCFSYNPYIENHCDTSENNCCVIRKEHIDLIGGFDKRFDQHQGYHFEALFLAVKYNLRLKITDHSNLKLINNTEIQHKSTQNKQIYNDIINIHKRNEFIYPKLLFLYWDGSPLSYLNYLTVITFNKHNPEWKIIVFKPLIKSVGISWKTNEQKILYSGKDWFYKLNDIYNISIQTICLDSVGFFNSASEVIKSDFFRYYILEKYGGVWSDFDIVYTNSIEHKMNFIEDTVIFKCGINVDSSKFEGEYYPIGLFLCKPQNQFFRYIISNCKEMYNPLEYQSIGATMFYKLLHNNDDIVFKYNVKVCNHEYYLPYAWNKLHNLYDKKYINNKLPINNIGIHWFNGADKSKHYTNNLNDYRLNNFVSECYIDTFVKTSLMETIEVNDETLCIIVPFRERYNNLTELIEGLMDYQQDIKLKVELYIINQSNSYLFNKGLLINAGFLEAGHIYKNVWISDCDCIPFNNNKRIDKDVLPQKFVDAVLSYTNDVSHVGSFLQQWDFVIENGNKSNVGALCSDIEYLKTEHSGGSLVFNSKFFKRINGFSNKYYGWGGEDCDNGYRIMYYRHQMRNEMIKYIHQTINDNITKTVINRDDIDSLNVEYSVYRFLLLIFNQFNSVEINKPEFLQKISSYDYKDPRNSLSNKMDAKYEIKFPPGLLLNRRPGMFNDSIHSNKTRSKSQISSISKNPNYNNNYDILNKIRNMYSNNYNSIHRFIQDDGLVNARDLYNVINHDKYNYNGFDFNVININTPSTSYKTISIVMAYINRREQLLTTLETFSKTKYPTDLFEVVIVDDGSNTEHQLDDIIHNYEFRIKLIKTINKTHVNPCIPFNMGFSACSGEIIIIQNPECAHIGDIISYASECSTDTNYLVLPCFTTINFEQNSQLKECLNNDGDYIKNVRSMITTLQGTYLQEWNGWYVHEKYNKRYLHFTSIISKTSLDKLNGFDERYGAGLWSDDDEFYERISMICNCSIVNADELLVIHQHHNTITGIEQGMIPSRDDNIRELLIKNNRDLLNSLIEYKKTGKNPNWLDYNNSKDNCILNNGQIHYKQINRNFKYELLIQR